MGLWDSIISGGAAIVGGLLGGAGGSNNNNASQTTTQDPWKPQQPYLVGGFQDAANVYNSLKNQPFYQGSLYAGLSPMQNQSIAGIGSFAQGGGTQAAQGLLGAGQASLGGAYGQMGVAGDLANFNAGIGTNFSRLTNFDPADPTRSNINAAGQYADNPYLDGVVRAASRDVTRNLTEDVLPGINRMGSATGNTNSSRTGIAEGIALRGAQDRIGDISAQIRGDAYQQGLGLAENARTANMQAQLQGLSQGLTNTENARQFNTNAQLNALSNAGNLYGSAYGQGIQGTTSGAQQMYNNLDAMAQAGALQQRDAQGQLNEQYAKWQGGQDRGLDLLDRYMQIIGGQYGSTINRTADNGQPTWLNTLQGGLGGAAAGLGLYNNFKNSFSQNQGIY